MYSQVLISTTALLAAGLVFAQDDFVVNSATGGGLTECQPYRITWNGGNPPFFPVVTAPGDTSQVLKIFPQTNDRFVVWTVDQPAGEKVTFAVSDSSGVPKASAPSVPIGKGQDESCLNGGGSTGGSTSTPAGGSSTNSPTGTTTPGSTSNSPTGNTSRTGTSTSNTATPTNTTPADGASTVRGYSAVVAAVVGVAVAALI